MRPALTLLAAITAVGLLAPTTLDADDNAAPTVEDAVEFIAEVEQWRREYGEYAARVAWVQATYITFDTNWLATRADTEITRKGVEFANRAKAFNDVALPEPLRRKMEKIKLGVNLPAPTRDGVRILPHAGRESNAVAIRTSVFNGPEY